MDGSWSAGRQPPNRRSAPSAATFTLAVMAWAVIGAVVAPAAGAADTAPYRAAVFTRGYDTAKVVTLSFDSDWPTANNTQSKANLARVLQVLAANRITAGFVLTGRFVEQNPAETAGRSFQRIERWEHR